MSFSRTNRRGAVLLIISICCGAAASASDDTFAQAKDLYATAAYDEALVVLDRLQRGATGTDSTAIAQYRVFCLLALDRRDEARKTMGEIFNENPLYLPSEDLASPRIQAIFRDTRRQLLPAIVRERYASAKAAFEQKDPHAAERFDAVLTLLDDPDVRSIAGLSDLRTVASAFRDLTKAMAAVAAAPPPVAVRAAQPPLQPVPIPIQLPPLANPNTVYTQDDADVVPPVAVAQRIPPWAPHARDALQEFRGTLELLVDERGAVMSATLRTSVHPAYDEQLLKAVRAWKFTPAKKQGVPVRYVKVIAIHLTPGSAQGVR